MFGLHPVDLGSSARQNLEALDWICSFAYFGKSTLRGLTETQQSAQDFLNTIIQENRIFIEFSQLPGLPIGTTVPRLPTLLLVTLKWLTPTEAFNAREGT